MRNPVHTQNPLTSQTSRMKASTPFPHAFNATGCTICHLQLPVNYSFSFLFLSFFVPFTLSLFLSLSQTVTIISKSVLLSTNEGFGFVHLRYSSRYMEKKEMAVMSVKSEEDVGVGGGGGSSSLLNGFQFSSVFDFYEVEKSSSLGFMELLGVENYSSLLDVPQLSTMSHHQTTKSSSDTNGKECSEVLNHLPQTPNSCSISSASSEAVNDEQHNKILVDRVQEDEDEEEEEKQKTSKQ